jgi:hypothetical protein
VVNDVAIVEATALQPAVDVAQASRHLEILHAGAPGFASIVLLGNDRRERHCFFPTADLVDSPSTVDGSREALQDVVDARWNVYTALSTFAVVPEKGRGCRADVLGVPGVWTDLDVKPDVEGYFSNESQLLSYVDKHLPRPTIEVASGSGGRHLYWLTHERLEARDGQELLLAWLDFLRAEAGNHTIENVHDTTRVLRLAGTVRWPKVVDDVQPMPRPVVLVNEGPRYHVEELRLLTSDAHVAATAQRTEARARRTSADELRRRDLTSRGLEEANYERVVRLFNAQQDWAPLLEATGWTLHSDQRDGAARCRYWTRPGKATADGKSASTDFITADGTTSRLMTVYSNDPALHDIRDDAGGLDTVGTCTKWRYALARLFNNDEVTLLRAVVANRGRLA